jgi:hypothetical protein
MIRPLVSLCTPTYHRARYLDSLLSTLVGQLEGFPYPFEVVIADNTSPDDTPEVVRRYESQLPIRYIRHTENIGCVPNVQYVMMQAQGRYVVYLSDDDCIMGPQLADTIARMEADPGIAVTFAPWKLFDLVDGQDLGQSYELSRDVIVSRGRHGELLDHLLRQGIVPDAHIARRDALQRLMPRINPYAFHGLVGLADYLGLGSVLLQKTPFYVSITRYFEDDDRSRAEGGAVDLDWDRYRGGLEYVLARAAEQISPEERAGLLLRIQQVIAAKMAQAVGYRHAKHQVSMDTYYIAMRVRGLGYEQLLPVSMTQLASEAMLEFLFRDPVIHRGAERLITVGAFREDTLEFLQRHSPIPVNPMQLMPAPADRIGALVLVSEGMDEIEPADADAAGSTHTVLHESDLMARFGL